MYTSTGCPLRSPSSSRKTCQARLPKATLPWRSATVWPSSRCSSGIGASKATFRAVAFMLVAVPIGCGRRKRAEGPSAGLAPVSQCPKAVPSRYSLSNPWLVNLSVLLFSVTVRTI